MIRTWVAPVVLLLALFASTVSFAQTYTPECGEDFRNLTNKLVTDIYETREIEVTSLRRLDRLREVEAQAVRDYLAFFDDQGIELPKVNRENSLIVETIQYRNVARNETVGYRASVRQADDDESNVRLYYSSRLLPWDGVEYRLLRLIWDNQSRVDQWICRGYRKR